MLHELDYQNPVLKISIHIIGEQTPGDVCQVSLFWITALFFNIGSNLLDSEPAELDGDG